MVLVIVGYTACTVVGWTQAFTRSEGGIGLYSQSNTYDPGTVHAQKSYLYSPFVRYSFNLNSHVAIETLAGTSVNSIRSYDLEGGHATFVLGGLKAGVRRGRVGFFGVLSAGATSYSRGDAVYNEQLLPQYGRETHFVLQQGGALETYLSRRFILRADIAENLSANFRSPVQQLGEGLSVYSAGHIQRHLALSLGVQRRFGTIRDDDNLSPLSPRPARYSLGLFFPLQIREQLTENSTPVLGGIGAWIGVTHNRYLSTDVVAFDLPHDDHTSGLQDGGTPFSLYAGPKIGFHSGMFSLYVKGRPGFVRFSRSASRLDIETIENITLTSHPQT